ncbi:MAG: SurA N-terminal domain-containing protein [Rubrivivax sp.]
MFEFIRTHTRLMLGFMLLLIIPSFIFFGVQGYAGFTDAANADVAKVAGQGITRAELDNAVRRYADRVRQENPTADPAQLDSPQVRREVLDSLVRDRVLLAAADKMQLYPTPVRMVRLFDSDPQFVGLRGPDGRLSRELLAAQGMSPELFDQRLRQEFASRQVINGVIESVQPPSVVVNAALDPLLQRRELQIQRFDPASYRDRVQVTDAEVEAYYQANTAQFQAPEQATIQYVVLDLDAIARSITVTDADERRFYAENASRYTAPEERRASHILIKAEPDAPTAERAAARARAEALLTQVKAAPGSFAEVARKNSSDTGSAASGGDLDFMRRGMTVKPFEDAMFGLKPGEISGIVESDFGFHIIHLTDVRGGQARPFESVRPEITAELRRAQAQRRWAEAAEQFTNTVYEQSDSLQPVVDKLKLEIKTAKVFRTPIPGTTGPLASAKLLDEIFGNDVLRNKRNADAVETAPNQLVSARMMAHSPARTLALDEVRDRVRAAVMQRESTALALKQGQERLAALRTNPTESLSELLTVSRAQPQGLQRKVLDAALGVDASKLPAVAGVDLGAQGYAVVRVMQVLPREAVPGGDDGLKRQYTRTWAAAESAAYLDSLKQRFNAKLTASPSALAGPAVPSR